MAPALRPTGAARRPAVLGRPTQRRRPPRHRPGAHRRRPRGARRHPRPGPPARRRRGPRTGRAHRRRDAPARPHRRQRHRRLGGSGLAGDIRLRPSRGTHLVLRSEDLGSLTSGLHIPIPGEANRFVLVLPQGDERVYVGLTDEPVDGGIPDVPEVPETDIGFLLDVLCSALDVPLGRDDVIGAFAGLRPLLDTRRTRTGPGRRTSPASTRCSRPRRASSPWSAASSPRTGAWRRTRWTPPSAPAVRPPGPAAPHPCPWSARRARRGSPCWRRPAASCAATARRPRPSMRSAWPTRTWPGPWCRGAVTGAELLWAVCHEGALDESDLLDRRTRIGLVPRRPGSGPGRRGEVLRRAADLHSAP